MNVLGNDGGNSDGGRGGGEGGHGVWSVEHFAKCRENRRRRLAMRRLASDRRRGQKRSMSPGSGDRRSGGAEDRRTRSRVALADGRRSSASSTGTSSEGELEHASWPSAGQPLPGCAEWPVAFGYVSVAGRMREMEDAVSLRPAFYQLADGTPMHFFGVFDGHGGSHVSALCRERLHVLLAEELAAAAAVRDPNGDEEAGWRAALVRSFEHIDMLAVTSCACGRATQPPCTCDLSGSKSSIVGSTANVILLARGRIVIANCGDSRAVLSRAGRAAALSTDHKPDRPDELARIESVGGRVIYVNGPRVRGILAMSRALGDKYLKPEVICEPEITIVDRTAADECLVMASDGLWDVVSNQLACDMARRCLDEVPSPPMDPVPNPRMAADDEAESGSESDHRCARAAAVLTRFAIGRDSRDNVSVIVIDLKRRG